MRQIYQRGKILLTALAMMLPATVWAAGEKASNIVVVADTRRVTGVLKYFSNLYNTDVVISAVWSVVLTVAIGCVLGFLMDFVMERTGLDLHSRKIIEH
ncbi:MAG: DVU0150 family protein [Desulfatitalea sp.]